MKKKNPSDVNQLAASILEKATGKYILSQKTPEGKNAAAVALGRLGGLKGGKARAEKLSSRRRKEIASRAAKARWEK